MLTRIQAKTLAIATGLLVSATGAAHAQDCGPLVDLLVKKGIVSDQEGEELKTELTKSFVANSSAGKLNLSSALSEFAISGDVRLRHETSVQVAQPATNATSTENTRERFRLRLNMDAKLQNGWGAGLALQTAQAADSGNQTFDNGGDNYSIFLSRAYISYTYNNEWSFVGGKFKNPLYTTDLEWDPDINPQGLSQTFKKSIGGASGKDTFEVRAMQSIMKDNAETNWGAPGRDAWLFAQQAVYTGYFGNGNANSFIVAPGYMTYNASTIASGPTNSGAFLGSVRYLKLLSLPAEVNFAGIAGEGTSLKVYGQFIHNMEATDRVTKVYGLSTSKFSADPNAWILGVGYSSGSGKTKGDWSVRGDYREIGIGSIDPNINDSDFAFSNLNQRGFKVGASYNVTDFASVAATYFYSWDKQGSLVQSAIAKIDHAQILQLDMSIKF
jgi:hypothetical protein